MFFKLGIYVMVIMTTLDIYSAKVHHRGGGRQVFKFLKNKVDKAPQHSTNIVNSGMWPSVFNLATKAAITANATCGERTREEFCRMSDNGKVRCGICDNYSSDPGKKHSIQFAIDGSNKWWQSPALYYGHQYEYVTITIDLKQVYQITYITIKVANSPRPGTWVLERSIDGEKYEPWQYFARNDKECLEMFGIAATKGKPQYSTNTDVICTTFYSRLNPLENGEIHIPLIQGRPGANEINREISEFTKAQYVRLRLMGIRGNQDPLPQWLSEDIWKSKKLFYSIRDINIGGHCLCNGHAENCRHNVASGHPQCECGHNTCGANCEKCCALYNQQPWSPGTSDEARSCVPCNCHGHSERCHYDENIDKAGLSMDIHGNYQGGGVCENCTNFTAGVNCELCIQDYYRPLSVSPAASQPCVPCSCSHEGTLTCIQYGKEAGKCICSDGYSGENCDKCAVGYYGWPKCEPCTCDARGILNSKLCGNDCLCKENVEGKYCDRCKPGHFGLKEDLLEGCFPCYCSGVTTLCESAILSSRKIQLLNSWMMTDLKVSRIVKPSWNGQSVFSLGNYEFPGVKSLYWLAPDDYLGNMLEAYNSIFHFQVQWVVMRGDTSGEPTRGPNIVIIGSNGIKIGYGNSVYTSSKMTFYIKMTEKDWYHFPENIKDIAGQSSNFQPGAPVSRQEFLSTLINIKHILLRSTFHTDQIESLLEDATMEFLEEELGYGSVEKCSCPSGYSGLSCETCSFGYVRIYTNLTNSIDQGYCAKCDCNGHSASCNSDTGECFCEHNTIGEKCERCAPGYYGNPLKATSVDCKKCACPLENAQNNFSPSCQLDILKLEEGGGNYVCTQCPKGYTGDHCEICDDGFYGDPMEIGNNCMKCDCNGGPCDRKTGQCLSCKGNTEGFKCEKCKPEHYGEPLLSNCKACECDSIGAVSKQCDNVTGQCNCKPNFVGRTCDRCKVGYGNVTALCQPCSCNLVGSKSEICDTHTGICECHPGVEGFHCDACQNLFYGFSSNGCQPCNCDLDGSKFDSCDPTTGQCVCKPHFIGSNCSRCEDGYWKNKKKCEKCNCNEYGSKPNINCDPINGRCICKSGVTGFLCDTCLTGYYGTVETDCKKCDPCGLKGHICDPNNGRCRCPPLTEGASCENCSENSWGYEENVGCKACNCSEFGSYNMKCDTNTGICNCKEGYQGKTCNSCSTGYYGYPECKKCICDVKGTKEDQCKKDVCECTSNGDCDCKENVAGKHCNTCKPNYFGLSENNPLGCTSCFCFNRALSCKNANVYWDKIRKDNPTNAMENISQDMLMLPGTFLGDLTKSYGGYLSVDVEGQFSLYLEGHTVHLELTSNSDIIMTESNNWRVTSRNSHYPSQCENDFSRTCFMTVLQDVTKIGIKATSRIKEVLLDKAKFDSLIHSPIYTIEQCDCPPEYTGLSCQDPNKGYYRHIPTGNEFSWVDKIIGIAKPCDCNGKSNQCDANSGNCKNCSDYTSGDHCELCIDGYFKDKNQDCSPCLCPSKEQNNAKSCIPTQGNFKCNCKEGYKGERCEQCDTKYYKKGTNCEPCNCNPFGTVPGEDCLNGICKCESGFKGPKCDQCVRERQFIKNGICTDCDDCTQLLFNEIQELVNTIKATSIIFGNYTASSWSLLEKNIDSYKKLYEKFLNRKNQANNLIKKSNLWNLDSNSKRIQNEVTRGNKMAETNILNSDKLYETVDELVLESKNVKNELFNLINSIHRFGNSNITVEEALTKAEATQQDIKHISDLMNTLEKKITDNQCTLIKDKINSIYTGPLKNPYNVKYIQNMLDDLGNISARVEADIKYADLINGNNSYRLKKVDEKIQHLDAKHQVITNDIKNLLEKVEATNDLLEQLEIVYEDLINISKNEKFNTLKKKLKRQIQNWPVTEEVFLKSIEHVQQLENKVKKYSSMFNFTKDEWRKINASGAYETIINEIKNIQNSVNLTNNIVGNAIYIIAPDDYDGITDQANLAHTYSDRLKKRIDNFKNISKDLNIIKNKLIDLKYGIMANGKSNNDLTQILHEMERNITSQTDKVAALERILVNSTEVFYEMAILRKQAENIQFDKEHMFYKDCQEFFQVTSPAEINDLSNRLKLSKKELQRLNVSCTNSNLIKKLDQMNKSKTLDTLKNRLDEIHKRIDYARQIANTITVSLSISNCTMSYKPKYQYFKSINVTYKCNECKDSQLFTWKKYHGPSFSVLQVGQELKLIAGDSVNKSSLNTKTETTIAITRVGDCAKLFVGRKELLSVNVNSSFNIMDVKDTIIIGGSKQPNSGYISQIFLNEKPFGLWNFYDTTGNCTGHIGGLNNNTDKNQFTEDAYKMFGFDNKISKKQWSVNFFIKTFDENSLIYLAATDKCQQYISLYLQNGQIIFTVLHGKGVIKTIKSNKIINDGRKRNIQITMMSAKGQQQYNLQIKTEMYSVIENITESLTLNNTNLKFKIREAYHYVGGVPPTFNKNCTEHDIISFMGFLKINSGVGFTANASGSYGVFHKQEEELEFSNAWIKRNGFINLNVTDTKIRTLSFILVPSILSGTIFKFKNGKNLSINEHNITINLSNASIENLLKLNEYNFIQLYIAEKKQTQTHILINSVTVILNGEDLDTIIGIGDIRDGFVGGIREILVNDELLLFNSTSLAKFSNVDIGREYIHTNRTSKLAVKNLTMFPNFTNYMQNTEGCAFHESYEVEKNAIKFGGKTNSYVRLRTNIWKNDYSLKLDFRTSYPNGLVFVTSGHKHQTFIVLEVKESKLNLIIKGKRKDIPLTFTKKVSDGKWHTVQLNKKKRKLVMTLDTTSKPVKIPKINVRNELYLGGVPHSSDMFKFKNLKDKLLPFHGCMRSLHINEESIFSEGARNEKYIFSNTEKCFSNVEEGAYFSGNGYAIYDENYLVTDILELNFEFRTGEQNGIILSISHHGNSPAFSVELHNGALVMAVDTGNGAIRYASNNLDSDFALCNNQWHNVTTLYTTSELTVIVDGIRKTWLQPESNAMFDNYEATLYIGGIAPTAPTGTLKTRENFKGCIKKLEIDNIPLEWSAMNELHHVSLNGCPCHAFGKE